MPGRAVIPPTNGHSIFAETQQFFTKQRAAIDKLKADNELLKEELLLENKFSVRPTTTSAAVIIENLQEQSDVHTRKIGQERECVADLQRQVAAMQDRIAEQRRQMGGVNAARECDVQAEKAMAILENRVEQAWHRLNARRAATAALRDAIDGARKERLAMAELQRKLTAQLAAARTRAAALLQSSRAACLARDKARHLHLLRCHPCRALAETANLKVAGDKETAAAEAEWRQLTQLIEHDRKQKEMQRGRELAERAQSTSKLLREDVLRGAAAPKQAPRRPSWVDHPAAGGPAAGGPGGNATMDAPGGGVAALAKHLEDFTAAFARISEATGTAGVDELVAELSAKEDGSFRLFGYVGGVNSGVENLRGRMREVSAELERWQSSNAAQDSEHTRALQALQERLEEAEAAAAAWEAREAAADARAAALSEAVQALWVRSGCAGSGLEELLGGDGVPTVTNLMQYLGAIEQRTNHLLHEARSAAVANGTEAAQEQAPAAAAAIEEASWDPMRFLPSTLVDLDDNDGADAGPLMPLDRKALEARALQSLARRREQAQNTTGGPVSLGARVRASSSPGRRPPLTALGRTAAAVKRPVLTRPRR